ncbi:hypothetical protein NC652_011815 [Populus alba x Populus x berolinensis]|nr:hypothetical protein NC652_011815 [Populus alba x Populus x berolinensis]
MAVKLARWLLQCLDHLFFADDSFLLVRVNAQEINTVKLLLQQYEVASAGQSINLQKSGIFFSFNVRIECKQYISDIPAVHTPLNHGRCLGLPSLTGRNKKVIFSFIRDKLWKRINGWRGRTVISKAVKAVMITVRLGLELHEQWKAAPSAHLQAAGHVRSEVISNTARPRWCKPGEGYMKCNIDAAVFNQFQQGARVLF